MLGVGWEEVGFWVIVTMVVEGVRWGGDAWRGIGVSDQDEDEAVVYTGNIL
jgi:hypothetical protein